MHILGPIVGRRALFSPDTPFCLTIFQVGSSCVQRYYDCATKGWASPRVAAARLVSEAPCQKTCYNQIIVYDNERTRWSQDWGANYGSFPSSKVSERRRHPVPTIKHCGTAWSTHRLASERRVIDTHPRLLWFQPRAAKNSRNLPRFEVLPPVRVRTPSFICDTCVESSFALDNLPALLHPS